MKWSLPAALLSLTLASAAFAAAQAPKPEPKPEFPVKVLDDAGYTFNGDIVKALQGSVAKAGKANKNTFAVLGIGLPNKDIAIKAPNGWTYVGLKESAKELTGAAASPRNVLATLPDFLAKEKPEIVVIIPDQAAGRKTSDTELFDWEDTARLCIRFGAVPVFGISPTFPAADKDAKDLRTLVSEAALAAQCPAIDLKAPSQFSKRLLELMGLLEEHVYKRAVTAKPVQGPAGGGEE
jgi:hypothetical protein